jgi:hypothetical protein
LERKKGAAFLEFRAPELKQYFSRLQGLLRVKYEAGTPFIVPYFTSNTPGIVALSHCTPEVWPIWWRLWPGTQNRSESFGFAHSRRFSFSLFIPVSSVEATAAFRGTLSLRRPFGRGDFISLVVMGGATTRSCFGDRKCQATSATKWAF